MEQLTIYDYFNNDVKIDKPIRTIELFGGYGSQALALELMGAQFEHYRLVEFDKYAVNSYNAIHNTAFKPTDITKVHGSDLGIVNTDKYCYLLTYSFPCQDLSLAGKRAGMEKGSGTRSGLLWEVERLLKEAIADGKELPQVLFMENVKQVISKKNKPDFDKWCKFLESIGYTNTYKVLNAKDYGIPQNRERCFMFSFLGNYKYAFPDPIELKYRVKDMMEKEVDEKYYIKQNVLECYKEKKGIAGIGRAKNVNEISNAIRCGGRGSLDRHSWDLIAEPLILDDRDKGFGLKIADICSTQRATRYGLKVIDCDYRIRKLTSRECGRLMGVPDDRISKMGQVNSNTQLYKQFGNSIVVNCMIAMFSNLNIQGLPTWNEIKHQY